MAHMLFSKIVAKTFDGIKLVLAAFCLLLKEKRILVFTMVPAILALLVLLAGFNSAYHNYLPKNSVFLGAVLSQVYQVPTWNTYVINVLIRFFHLLGATFFGMAAVFYITQFFEYRHASLYAAFNATLYKWKTILVWAIVSAIVTTVLYTIPDTQILFAASQSDSMLWVPHRFTSILAYVLDIFWAVVTFFILPILAFENRSIFQSIKHSWTLMKQFFFQTLGGKVTLMFITGLFVLVALLVAFGVTKLFASSPTGHLSKSLLISFVLVASVFIAVELIFKVAIYQQARGRHVTPLEAIIQTKSHMADGILIIAGVLGLGAAVTLAVTIFLLLI